MREECDNAVDLTTYRRITPAHAGRMAQSKAKGALGWDHPRACGKNEEDGSVTVLRPGSPPRMREECILTGK